MPPEDLIRVDGQGAWWPAAGVPAPRPCCIWRSWRETGAGREAVLHTHSQAATLLSERAIATAGGGESDVAWVTIGGLEMLKGLRGITTHNCRIQLPVLPNDQDLERLSAAARPT